MERGWAEIEMEKFKSPRRTVG